MFLRSYILYIGSHKKLNFSNQNCIILFAIATLTFTFSPGKRNTFSAGISFGVKRKNSLFPLYHLTEYSPSFSVSYSHVNTVLLPLSIALGTLTCMIRIPIDISAKINKIYIHIIRKTNERAATTQIYIDWSYAHKKNFNDMVEKRNIIHEGKWDEHWAVVVLDDRR